MEEIYLIVWCLEDVNKILAACSSKEEAIKYIESYPNYKYDDLLDEWCNTLALSPYGDYFCIIKTKFIK